MPVTTLDPTSALLLIDLQQGIVALPVVHPIAPIVAHARALADAFRAAGLPVVLVNVAGGAPGRTDAPQVRGPFPDGFTAFLSELDRQPQDHVVTKHTWGAFTGTDLDTHLRGLGVTQLVIAGVATSIGVESTARAAQELGYNITLATDAMTDMSADAHDNSLARIFPRLGETGTSAAILALLAKRTA